MDIEDSGVGAQLRETASRLFTAVVSTQSLAAAEAGEWPTAIWQQASDAGLPAVLIPEESGGFGVPVTDALSILVTAGAHAVPLPLAEAMLAGWLLARAGFDVPVGVLGIADGTAAGLERAPSGCRLRGRLEDVAWGRRLDAVAVLVSEGVALLRAGQWTVEPGVNLAQEPRDVLVVDQEVEVRPAPARFGTAQLRAAGAVTRSLMIAGALQRVSDLTAQYAQERIQFGRPIGKFQAIQQNLAVLAGQAAAAAAAADIGADALADGLSLPAVAVAKSRTGEAAGIGSAVAHQVHGAIGFTYEHRLHFYTKRLLAWRNEYGTETSWNRLLGREIARAGADGLWPALTGL